MTVLPVESTSADVYSDYAGRVRASRQVEVRARVDGILEERLYDEGSVVSQGEPLFRIDPKPFEVAVLAAQAERETAQADLRQAESDWQRIARLFDRNAISERERDMSRARLEVAKAALAAADAGLQRAELELGYTQVEAPIAGVTSLEAQSEGTLVSRGTLLTEIVQRNPVHVRFALPESDAALQHTALQAMSNGNGEQYRREARLLLPDGSEYSRIGEIDFTASTVDPNTGTVLARAVFDNPEGEVAPGQFVRVRMLLHTLDDVIVVPESAVGQGPQGPQVFVVDEEDTARSRIVELGPLVADGRVVLSGLEAGDRVVINGQVALQDGAPVTPEVASDPGDADEADGAANAGEAG
ncbi:efflux RND transporter periplasmic adaptor subunit [Fodinicurvata sp. CAU 1616]|uniref:Efflux RND transporter periplasmic adaptor subunit n=1 Tax=Aquibaculum arenosum TaxID=3032591 RepID=A0ABT5YJD5_9PROT|nr:efflux RND transporter periplasmic adaptor subunit [Fodinicurvata sp. CAU 1616]